MITQEYLSLKPSLMVKAIATAVRAKQPVLLRGVSGSGKTDIYSQVADQLDHDLIVDRLALMDPVDLRGLPSVTDRSTSWMVPDYFPREGCRDTIWFFDEWAQGSTAVQNAAGQLLNERRLGGYKLPDNVVIMAASNWHKDRAGTNRLPSHIADRFLFLNLEVDLDDWCKWAFRVGLRVEVIAFMRFRSELLSVFDPNVECGPSPRSWAQVSAVLEAGPCLETELAMYAGKVGLAAAGEFMAFLKVFRTLPSVDQILLNPGTVEVPQDQPATLYALAGSLARRSTEANFDRVITYANRMPQDVGVCLVQQAVQRHEELKTTAPFIRWASENSEFLN